MRKEDDLPLREHGTGRTAIASRRRFSYRPTAESSRLTRFCDSTARCQSYPHILARREGERVEQYRWDVSHAVTVEIIFDVFFSFSLIGPTSADVSSAEHCSRDLLYSFRRTPCLHRWKRTEMTPTSPGLKSGVSSSVTAYDEYGKILAAEVD